MAWLYLLSAGVLEIVWAFTMKQSDGFTRPMPTVITIVTMIGSFALLSLAMRIAAALLIVSGLVMMKLSAS